MLLSAPIIPFTAEENYMHAFGKTMYEDSRFQWSGGHSENWDGNQEDLKAYQSLYEIRMKIKPMLDFNSKGQPNSERPKFHLNISADQVNWGQIKTLQNYGTTDLKAAFDVGGISFLKNEEYTSDTKLRENCRGSFKNQRVEYRLIDPTRTKKAKTDFTEQDIEL